MLSFYLVARIIGGNGGKKTSGGGGGSHGSSVKLCVHGENTLCCEYKYEYIWGIMYSLIIRCTEKAVAMLARLFAGVFIFCLHVCFQDDQLVRSQHGPGFFYLVG